MTSLTEAVRARPFPEYARWWPMGGRFLAFMAAAIGREWAATAGAKADRARVEATAAYYIRLVYDRESAPGLADRFLDDPAVRPIESGEFDALSYAFYHTAFEALARHAADEASLATARRDFTVRVGRAFFAALSDHLALELPAALATAGDFARLREAIAVVGRFLTNQGYLRDHFAFTFDVDVSHAGRPIRQRPDDFLPNLHHNGLGHALYEMGYPVILPSAVYLYQTVGEAQHHSSRTIEELFARAGADARETADFDPSGFPSDRVVELWEIRPQ